MRKPQRQGQDPKTPELGGRGSLLVLELSLLVSLCNKSGSSDPIPVWGFSVHASPKDFCPLLSQRGLLAIL